MIEGFIFDLDGVLVDTAKYHYMAWRKLAQSLGFDFTPEDNERLKGVSRMQSLDILLSIGGIQADEQKRLAYAEQKNAWYVEYISRMGRDEILPEADRFVREGRALQLKTAIASASKNTSLLLDRLGIAPLFDAVIDGTHTSRAKPDPEVFLLAAEAIGKEASHCVVFEDAAAGIQAARRAGMYCVGIGSPQQLSQADVVIRTFRGLSPQAIIYQLETITF